jgi:hypothetical protein
MQDWAEKKVREFLRAKFVRYAKQRSQKGELVTILRWLSLAAWSSGVTGSTGDPTEADWAVHGWLRLGSG